MLKSLERKARAHVKSALIRLRSRPENFSRKLHLGCGGVRADGWCNVDIYATSAVDVLDDIRTLRKFPNNYADRIYSCHVLEHFSHEECLEVLKRWFDVLRPGGEIRTSVPDLDRIVKIYCTNWEHFQTDGNSPWIGLIYGGQWNQYDFHKTGYNYCWMKHIKSKIGFENIETYSHTPHFISGLKDASLAHEPFGEYFSLNVVANKPA